MITLAFERGLNPKVSLGIGVEITEKMKMDYIKRRLSTDQKWAQKALKEIFKFQTEGEKISEETHEHNKKGFTGTDGGILTSFAKQLEQRGFLTPKQMVLVYKKMPKYWKQIEKISDKNLLESLIRNDLTFCQTIGTERFSYTKTNGPCL